MKVVDKIRNSDVVVDAPPSKAHTLRALIIGSLSAGKCTIYNPLLGEDQRNVIECLKRLGVEIKQQSNKITVAGTGGKYMPVNDELNVGESGVGMNFLASAVNLADKPVVITGSKRITERPIREVVEGLRQLGCKIEYLGKEGFPPIRVNGGGIAGGEAKIRGGECSQYFSSIVISSPYAEKKVTLKCIDEMTEKPYFDISLQMMAEFGVKAENKNYKQIEIPKGRYSAREITIEGDYSSASFFFLAGAICKSKVTVKGLRPDTKQGDKAFVAILEKMGCEVSETGAGICVEGRELTAIEQDMSDLPDLVPPLAIACAFAKGESRLTNIGHLRNKECDRLAVMALELGKMGAEAACDESGLIIRGSDKIHGGEIDPHNDHRIAMSFSVAGLAAGNQTIENEMCVAKSFPDFWERFEVFYK
ncbi:MAG: 3-phosphoshikimate 1-carboxyvinyltransferase [Sedimentisphaerales bacterium]|nr:3-phosphoshikimate 1-carboxyvinyltransferase [Sedimentisphaerales bacterium]